MSKRSSRGVMDLAFSGVSSDGWALIAIPVVFKKLEIRPDRYVGCTSGSVRVVVDGINIEAYTKSELVDTEYQLVEEDGMEASLTPKVSVETEPGGVVEAEFLTAKSGQKTVQETHFKGTEATLSAIPEPGNGSAIEWWFYLPRGAKIVMDCLEKSTELMISGPCNRPGRIPVKVVGEPKGPIFLGRDFRALSKPQLLALRIRLHAGRDYPRFDRFKCVVLGTVC